MKIRIQDFGPIRDFTFDLDKDLHLLYGKNGTGKSYAVYCVYVILKQFLRTGELFALTHQFILNKKEDQVKEYSTSIIGRIRDAQIKSDINIDREVEDIIRTSLSYGIKSIENSNFVTVAEQLYEERMRLSSEITD